MEFAIIQTEVNNSKFAVIRLADGSYVSPAGYVVGEYKVIFPRFNIEAARKILNNLLKGEFKMMGKFELIKAMAEQYNNFPFRQQVYAIHELSKLLNCQVFFEQIGYGNQHLWTVQARNNRKMGQFTICSKIEE